ncbi:hypothetical protein O6H91_23G003000 [Diphasiastrum complanatum]|uniref:Uncharacterized protein n=3 Tax=Diphasiastrum complanatum TaxID=34168 RepID=A0ACC2A7K9_DIPCM|nr:hypothetical protein O6H91_23G003000 [Diphasiastrum complanatum]KAJ7513523.1 hypothetical protein O6H91_23G003000 [Diphasiastrum complanatum]KAJ7513524.1 hypothetical protein O6H91_23G003000 [Diphasiastrum complanatum]
MANFSRNGHMQTQFMRVLLLACLSFIYIAGATSIVTQKMNFVSVDKTEINNIQNRRSKSSNRILNDSNSTTLSKQSEEGFRVELIHRDSPSSYLGLKNITRLERLRLAVQRSQERARNLAATQNGYGASFSQKTTTTDFTSPVASDFGAYLMQLKLGNPVQNFQAIVDTGSDLVWVQCNPCRSCYNQQGSVFSPSSSSTYKQLPCNSPKCSKFSNRICNPNCQYVYQYGDQSGTMGDFSSETITMTTTTGSSQQIPDFAFGCGHSNMGSFGGAGGLVGLGQGSASLTTQLGTQIQRKFSYCLVSFDDAPSTTSPLFFGSAADLRVPGVRSTPILKQGSTYYYVGLGGVSVGGKQASGSATGLTIFDSGTTLTLLEDPVYAGLKSAFQNSIHLPPGDGSAAGFDLCFDATGLTSYDVPTLSLHFTKADFNPPAANYFVLVDSNTLCLAIASSQGLGLSIIGNIMQQNYHIKYDRGKFSLSFVPTTCDSL